MKKIVTLKVRAGQARSMGEGERALRGSGPELHLMIPVSVNLDEKVVCRFWRSLVEQWGQGRGGRGQSQAWTGPARRTPAAANPRCCYMYDVIWKKELAAQLKRE